MQTPTSEELAFLEKCKPNDINEFIRKCSIYGDFLYETNKTMNLTRIMEGDFWSKHICDSLSLAMYHPMPDEHTHLKMCDVGCGAGLPSLVLAAAFPNLYVTAIDSTGKKIAFVQKAADRMGLTNIRTIQVRANELGHKGEFRHSFRLVTARAVGSVQTMLRETENLLTKNGTLVLYRSPLQAKEEEEWLQKTGDSFHYEFTEPFSLPGGDNEGTRLFLLLHAK